ncbi:MAG TPA: hypothetical protein VFI02_20780 [Armatimonadota bacterium]|nr:hypothetical protein [Armatimonadota bacterium]
MRKYVLSLIFAVLLFMLCSSGFAFDDTDLWEMVIKEATSY